jgi:hypothetical protein
MKSKSSLLLFLSTLFFCPPISFANAQTDQRTFASTPQPISQVVAIVDNKAVTSREVIWFDFIDQIAIKKVKKPVVISVESPEFQKSTGAYTLSRAIYLDAQQFAHEKPTADEINKIAEQVVQGLVDQKVEEFFRPSPDEIKNLIETKLVAESFLKFKSQTSSLPVTDLEARKYYDDNRVKFESVEFEKVKKQIKLFIAKTQVEERMQTWFALLQEKYGYRNLVK